MVGFAETNPIFAASQQSSQRREQRQTENKVLWLALPSRILSSLPRSKVVKGESRDKQKTKFYGWLCRAESYLRCHAAK